MKIAFIVSTNGGVLSKVIENDYFRNSLEIVISDRECGALEIANKYGKKTLLLPSKSGLEFSNQLVEQIDLDKFDLFISFYTRLFRGAFLDKVKGKLINVHPSILPAFPGMNGFEDTLKNGTKFYGATVHFIDEGIDTGAPIIQCARALDPSMSEKESRHLLFIDQCKMLLQTVKWMDEGRVRKEGASRCYVESAKYQLSYYAPNLDFEDAIVLQ